MENNKINEKIQCGVYTLSGQRKGRSSLWNILAEIKNEVDEIVPGFVYCRSCFIVLKYKNGQTSNLNRHKCCKATNESTVLKKVSAEDKSEAIKVCANWVSEDCRPFSAVKGAGFMKMVKFFLKVGSCYGEDVDLDDLIPDPTTVSRNVQKTAEQKKRELRREISEIVRCGGASATIDMWTDHYVQRNFLGITFHYVVDNKFNEIVIGMKSMDFEKSTSHNIIRKLNSVFQEFGVDNTEHVKFVTDRGSFIVKALENNTRINCSSHLLSNVLEKSFSVTMELAETTKACKKITKYFKKANLQHLLVTSLINQCPTRWNSQCRMLKSIHDNWAEINRILAENDESRRLLNINISFVKSLVEVCENLEIVFKKLQCTKAPSLCFVIPSIVTIKQKLGPSPEDVPAIGSLKINILENIDKIWVRNLSIWHKVAFFLYPPAIGMQATDLDELKEFCVSLVLSKTIENLPSTPSTPTSTSSFSIDSDSLTDSFTENDCLVPPSNTSSDAFFFSQLMGKSAHKTIETPIEEVDRYAKEIVEMSNGFNLLEWWKTNKIKYPYLYKVAMQIHSIPASSAAAERTFSLASNIITEKRKGLAPGSVDSLIFLNSIYKNNNGDIKYTS